MKKILHSNKYILLFILIVLGNSSNITAQMTNIGHPFVKHYTKKHHHGGVQNWDINQSKEGKMLFANNWGLLIFDGRNWDMIPSKNGMTTRRIFIDSSSLVYYGGRNSFGYYETNDIGQLDFTQLSDSLSKDERFFGAIWDISSHDGSVFFRSSRKVFRYYKNKIQSWETNTYFPYIGTIDNSFIIFNSQKGFYKLVQDSMILINNNEQYKDEHIINILTLKDGNNIIFTEKNGLFYYNDNKITPWKIDADIFLKEKRITSAAMFDDDRIAIGTRLGGIIVINTKGETLELLDRNSGLTSNNNQCLFVDRDNNLWAAQEKGIEYIQLEAPFRMINHPEKLDGIGYTVKIYKDHIYFGTSTGLYTKKWSPHYDPLQHDNITKVEGSDGQVRGLDIIGDELLMSHHDGIYRIIGDKARKIKGADIGSWSFAPIKGDDKLSINGNYRGLALYKKHNGLWELDHQIEGFDFTSRGILWYDDAIWVAHPYKGIYKIELSEDFSKIDNIKTYKTNDGLPKNSYYNTLLIDKKLYCGTNKGLYIFKNERFEEVLIWKEKFSDEAVKFIQPGKDDELYYLTEKEFGLIKGFTNTQEEFTNELIIGPKDWFVGGFEYLYPMKNGQAFLSTEDGFVLYKHKNNNLDNLEIFYNSISISPRSSTRQLLSINNKEKSILKHDFKSINFDYIVPCFKAYSPILYQYQLEGYDQNWSNWSQDNTKEYSNLMAGDYSFKVRAKSYESSDSDSLMNNYSQILNFDFEVKPIWYQSTLARWLYLLIFILFTAGLIFFPRKKHKAEKQELEHQKEKIIEEHKEVLEEHQEVIEEHKGVIEQTEYELNLIKTQRLQEDIQHKNKELMSITMHLTQKNEVIQNMKDALIALSKTSTQTETTKTIKKLIRVLNTHDNSDKDWEQFTKHFDQVHTSFFQSLRNEYPKLTPRDIRLCAYLRLNLSTKEIAPLMGISVRGVEISRYRLRKKLGLEKEINLVKFLMKYE